MTKVLLLTLGSIALLAASAAVRAENDPSVREACFVAAIEPVVTLDYASRYKDDSKTRSDFDEKSNAEVEKALGPIDDFIGELVRESNRALSRQGDRATDSADCVMNHLDQWASADAFSDLQTDAVRMSLPSRLAGMAFAFSNARVLSGVDPDRDQRIADWLRARAAETIAYFTDQAPPRASANNLRAWAGLAVTRIGLDLADEPMIAWGEESFRRVVCDVNKDGSLPREMERGALALHYQIHALGPLVLIAALLEKDREAGLFDACEKALPRAVGFMQAALKNPELAEEQAVAKQSFQEDDAEELKPFELAFAPAYLRYVPDAELQKLADGFKSLANSKLGGDQRLLWEEKADTTEKDATLSD